MSCKSFSTSLTGLRGPVIDSTIFCKINLLVIYRTFENYWMGKMIEITFGDAWAPRIRACKCAAPGTSRGNPPFEYRVRSLHSRQFRTAQVHTKRKHCRNIPPLDIFFSASNSLKFSELAKIKTYKRIRKHFDECGSNKESLSIHVHQPYWPVVARMKQPLLMPCLEGFPSHLIQTV